MSIRQQFWYQKSIKNKQRFHSKIILKSLLSSRESEFPRQNCTRFFSIFGLAYWQLSTAIGKIRKHCKIASREKNASICGVSFTDYTFLSFEILFRRLFLGIHLGKHEESCQINCLKARPLTKDDRLVGSYFLLLLDAPNVQDVPKAFCHSAVR